MGGLGSFKGTIVAAMILTFAGGHAPFVVLTTQLPRTGTEADRALRAPGPGGIFDVVDLLGADAPARLEAYGRGRSGSPRVGFWTAADVTPGTV